MADIVNRCRCGVAGAGCVYAEDQKNTWARSVFRRGGRVFGMGGGVFGIRDGLGKVDGGRLGVGKRARTGIVHVGKGDHADWFTRVHPQLKITRFR
jgi:hypothetical protein